MLSNKWLWAQIGLRFLRVKSDKKFISFISLSAMLGIAIGISVLIVIMSAMNGFEKELRQSLLSVVPHGEVNMVNKPIDNWQGLVEKAKLTPGVEAGAPIINITGLIMQGNDLSGVQIEGILPQYEERVLATSRYIDPTAWQALAKNEGGIILGQGIIKQLDVELGDRVSLMIPKSSPDGRFLAPTPVSFTLIGSFAFGGQIDHSKAFIHLEAARELAGLPQGVSGVRFKFNDVFNATPIIRDVASNIDQYVYLSDWTRKHGHLYNDIKLVKMITYLVLILVIGVASFNIVSTLVMAVQDKQSEIAILLTMGLTNAKVMKIFIVQGMLSALSGCIIGGLSGSLLAIYLSDIVQAIEGAFDLNLLAGDIYFIDFIPSEFQWQDLMLLIGATLLISFVATLYPARKASQIQPAVVLGQ